MNTWPNYYRDGHVCSCEKCKRETICYPIAIQEDNMLTLKNLCLDCYLPILEETIRTTNLVKLLQK